MPPAWRPIPTLPPLGSDPRAIRAQVLELLRVRHPERPPTDAEVEGHLGPDPGDYGQWWSFPWRGAAVQLLPEPEFREVRESRNRYKITREEAARLREKRIAVLGLGAGHAIAVALAMEGVGGHLRIADGDVVELSNLNRIRASVLDLGLPKWVLTGRALGELDPWLDVEAWPRRVDAADIDRFLDGVDLLVEECDDLDVKFLAREVARRRRIPVLMHTSDRGLLDVERFDLQPSRPIFHGLVSEVDARELGGRSAREKVPLIARILGEPSVRSAVTLPEVGTSVVSWPQLASEVCAGAAAVTDAARRILLGEPVPSGRWACDPDAALDPARAVLLDPAVLPPPAPALLPQGLPPVDDPVAFVAAAAALAPSAHNTQPWRFVARGPRLEAWRDRERWRSQLDPELGVLDAMLGHSLENAVVAASALGLQLEPQLEEGDLVWSGQLAPGARADALVGAIGGRHTNRRMPEPRAIPGELLDNFRRDAEARGARLLLTQPDEALGAACAASIRAVALDLRYHGEMMDLLRWSRAEVEATRDGLDVDTLELDGLGRVGLRLFSRPNVARLSGALGLGARIGLEVADNLSRAPQVGLVVHPGGGRAAAVAMGRALQRIWLRATLFGVSVFPMGSLAQLRAAHAHDGVSHAAFAAHERTWARHFPEAEGQSQYLLVRFAYTGPASARSLRRPLDAVFRRE